MASPYRRHVRNNFTTILDDLIPDEVVPLLFQEKYLTRRQFETIQSISVRYDKNLQLLHSVVSEDAHKCFFKALETTSQSHLLQGFVDDGRPANQRDAGAIAGPSAAGDEAGVSQYDPKKYDALTEEEYMTYVSCGVPEANIQKINQCRKERSYDLEKFNALTEKEKSMFRQIGAPEETIEKFNQDKKKDIDAMIERFQLSNKADGSNLWDGKTDEICIVFIGRSGDGKSESANTLVGKEVFKAGKLDTAVTELLDVQCFEENGRRYRVIDTPGIIDREFEGDQAALLLAKVLDECPDGVHVFLYIRKASDYRFTVEQQRVKECIQNIFQSAWTLYKTGGRAAKDNMLVEAPHLIE